MRVPAGLTSPSTSQCSFPLVPLLARCPRGFISPIRYLNLIVQSSFLFINPVSFSIHILIMIYCRHLVKAAVGPADGKIKVFSDDYHSYVYNTVQKM